MAREAGELSERKKLILKAIVDAHIADGEPVGSKYLMESKQIPCSSATIRNEMAELEAMGYLEQPHTSAGRVPSELGYRFYVDSLVEHYAMTAKEITEINQTLRAKMAELDQILLTASKVASSMTNYTGIAIKPRTCQVCMRRFDAVFMDARNFILVLVASNGQVKTKNIHVDVDVNVGVTDLLAAVLNDHLRDLSADQITLPTIMEMEQEMGERAYLINPIIKVIYDVMNELDGGELPDLLSAIENKDDILEMVSTPEGDDIQVVIGSEGQVKVMDRSAFVYKPIIMDGRTLGAIGILGPARMDYARVLATLEEITGNISNLLNEHTMLGSGGENDNHES